MPELTLLYGPTASGKSSVATHWAQQHNGVVINGDALQIYNALPILTAQPSLEEKDGIPHFLYGTHDPQTAMNAHDWALTALPHIQSNAHSMIVGGTGLYIKTLLEGLSEIPDIAPQHRETSENLYQELGADRFQAMLHAIDPESATNIHNKNRQRMVRAYEVYLGTGKPFSSWRNAPKNPVLPRTIDYHLYLLLPDKDVVIERAIRRFDVMMDMGVVEEVKKYRAQFVEGSAADQALGLQAFYDYIDGHDDINDTKERVILETRQYIKRQYTWARGQFKDIENITIIQSGDELLELT